MEKNGMEKEKKNFFGEVQFEFELEYLNGKLY